MPSEIHYVVQMPFPQNHLFEIVLTIDSPHREGQLLRLPTWIAGSYLVRDFARHIVSLKAECNSQVVRTQKKDKSTWEVAPVQGVLKITYEVYAYDLSVRGAYLDTRRGFFNGASLFLSVVGQEDKICRLVVEKPADVAYDAWQIATSLPILKEKRQGFEEYSAENYDALIDHPVELGEFSRYTFEACGVPHEVVIAGQHRVDAVRLVQDMQKICAYQIEFFGGMAPFTRYVFLILATANEYGGLEHRSSTALVCSRDDLPLVGQQGMFRGYQRFLGLVSHEYFHSWNVKRIKPAVFAPYDLMQENYTCLLWAFEGITSYYDDLTLVRTGLMSRDEYLLTLGQTISSVLRNPGTEVQNLEEASFDAWIKYYRQDENSPNSLVSYYTKGAIVALLLDATIRQRSNGVYSLDTVMQALWRAYGESFFTQGLGISEKTWENLAQEVTGLNLNEFFQQALRETSSLPLQETLAYLGVECQIRAASQSADLGGVWEESINIKLVLGMRFTEAPLGVHVTHVLTGSPAELGGLAAGDIVIAMDGLLVTTQTLENKVAEYTVNDRLLLHVFRRDELLAVSILLFEYNRPVCALRMRDDWQETHGALWLSVT